MDVMKAEYGRVAYAFSRMGTDVARQGDPPDFFLIV